MADENVQVKDRNEPGDEPHQAGRTGESHHHRNAWGRLRHSIRHNRKVVVPALFIGLIIAVFCGIIVYGAYRESLETKVQASSPHDVSIGYQRIAYNGKRYRYNSRITSILFAGVDSIGDMEIYSEYRFAPRADSIHLIVLDEYNKKMTIIGINRNTLTPIHKYTIYGHDRGEFLDQIAGSFCYGNNGDVSCINLCEAVSRLMYGIPIKDYVVANRSSLPGIGRIVGDVTVTVPNNDLAKYGYNAGDTAVIDSNNIARFLRSRDINVDFSNNGRMERQRAYINGAIKQIVKMLRKKPSSVWKKIQAMENCMQTNITRSRYIDLTNTLTDLVYEEQDFYSPVGENKLGEQFEEFYVDEDKLLENVIDIFYIEE